MRLDEILSEEQLDELNRRDFLKYAGATAMGTALSAAALDQGTHADEVEQDRSAEVKDKKKPKKKGKDEVNV